jgi:cation diffusion facilitator CzcD-associated flavoprotein CzcO
MTKLSQPDVEVLIAGAGFGGLGAAVELSKAGIEDFLIVDKNDGIGGTWHVNTYPGVAVDIPSIYYSFSYEPPKQWTRMFAPGAEVKAYAEQVVDSYGLRDRILLSTTITGADWDEPSQRWTVTFEDGTKVTARFFIGAVGALEVPNIPDIPGIESFEGKIAHTARWDHDYEYVGKRIAVIGTGATALQLIPEMGDRASDLTVYQRRPIWVAPKPDFPIPACKRPSVSNRYLKTFTKANVELVTDSIEKITDNAVVTSDGTVREADVLVCATGFKVMGKGTTPPFPIRGTDGRELNQFWDENRFQAYQGVSVPGFPNTFMITGPYGFAAGSYLAMIECTSRHAARAIAETLRREATKVEIKQAPHDRYFDKSTRRASKTMWLSAECEDSNTYYVNYQGDAAAIRPSTHLEMWWGNKHFPLSDYRYTRKAVG